MHAASLTHSLRIDHAVCLILSLNLVLFSLCLMCVCVCVCERLEALLESVDLPLFWLQMAGKAYFSPADRPRAMPTTPAPAAADQRDAPAAAARSDQGGADDSE